MQHAEPVLSGRARPGYRALWAGFAALLLACLCAAPPAAAAQEVLPRPPCGTTPSPSYPAEAAPGAAPATARAWQSGTGLPRWTPPACTGWPPGRGQGFRVLVALAGRITMAPGTGTEDLLGRFAAVSRLGAVRCWSTSDTGPHCS